LSVKEALEYSKVALNTICMIEFVMPLIIVFEVAIWV